MSVQLNEADELVAMVLAASGIQPINYNALSALSGRYSTSSFEHKFRNIRKRAVHLKEQWDTGNLKPVEPRNKKRTADEAEATGDIPVTRKPRIKKVAVGPKATNAVKESEHATGEGTDKEKMINGDEADGDAADGDEADEDAE